MEEVVGVGFLALALEVFFAGVGQHDEAHDLVVLVEEEFVGALFNQGDGGRLGQTPVGVVGVHAADGGHAFQRVEAVGAIDVGDGAAAEVDGHGKKNEGR